MGAGRRDGADVLIDVRVQPRASRSEFAGLLGDRLRIRLQAPPVEGRANAALIEFLAEACGVPRSRVTIEQGLANRDKRVRIRAPESLPDKLTALLGLA